MITYTPYQLHNNFLQFKFIATLYALCEQIAFSKRKHNDQFIHT
jgi:hypothetical protein